MKLYITATFRQGVNKNEIDRVCALVKQSGHKDFCFVRDIGTFNDDRALMRRAKVEIEKCDAMLVDYDGPAVGRMIEMGIAYALGKKVIITTRRGTVLGDTATGIADKVIEYNVLEDIVEPLSKL